jgi:uncharacterized protein
MTHAVRHRPEGRAATTPGIPGRYLSLTSFRRDGSGVATPVWFVQAEGQLRVVTEASSYKVRRIRRDPRVTIAPCTATGRLHGTPVPAWAELLPDAALAPTKRLMAAKYRVDLLFIKPLRTLQAALGGRPAGTAVVLEITPGGPPTLGAGG